MAGKSSQTHMRASSGNNDFSSLLTSSFDLLSLLKCKSASKTELSIGVEHPSTAHKQEDLTRFGKSTRGPVSFIGKNKSSLFLYDGRKASPSSKFETLWLSVVLPIFDGGVFDLR
jgi:hypothetical protein